MLLEDRTRKSSMDVLSYQYGISEIGSYALLEYFDPLVEYLNLAPIDQVPITHKKRISKTTTTTTTTPGTKDEVMSAQNDQQIKQTFGVATTDTNVQIYHNQSDGRIVGDDGFINGVSNYNVTEESEVKSELHIISVWTLLAIITGVCTFLVLAIVVFKRIAYTRRRRTNNRRFET